MAVPARSGAADPGPAGREPRQPDPLSPGWAAVRQAMLAAAELAAIAADDLRGSGAGGGAVLRRADLLAAMLGELAELGRRWQVDEAVLAAERQRAYAQGVADCKAARSRLSVLGD